MTFEKSIRNYPFLVIWKMKIKNGFNTGVFEGALLCIGIMLSCTVGATTFIKSDNEAQNKNEIIQSVSNPIEFGYTQIAHSDGWDEQNKWIGVNVYRIVLKQGDKVAVGDFGIQGMPNVPKGSEGIVWRSKSDGFLDDVSKLSDLPEAFNMLSKGERFYNLDFLKSSK